MNWCKHCINWLIVFGCITCRQIKKQDFFHVKKEDFTINVSLSGTITPNRKAIVNIPYSGYIQKIFVEVGDSVQKGQPVALVTEALKSSIGEPALIAPFSGIVTNVFFKSGEYVRKEFDKESTILKIEDKTRMYVQAECFEQNIHLLKIGQPAEVHILSFWQKKYQGIVREVSLASIEQSNWFDRGKVIFPILIEVLDFDEHFLSGLQVSIDVTTLKKPSVFVVPYEYIFFEDNNPQKPYVMLASGKRSNIQIGAQGIDSVEVTSGVQLEDQLQKVEYFSKDLK